MNEHESNLLDLYAGFAMLGLIMNGNHSTSTVPHMAHDVAEQMLRVRKERADEREEANPISDVAVSDVEGREDSAAQGIAALKKAPRTRSKT
jgi:hypothetical protein